MLTAGTRLGVYEVVAPLGAGQRCLFVKERLSEPGTSHQDAGIIVVTNWPDNLNAHRPPR
jgi:hypothetical protein